MRAYATSFSGLKVLAYAVLRYKRMHSDVVHLGAGLQRRVDMSRDEDATKHLREYAPVMSLVKVPVGWRVVDPVSR
jgi:hypothetical protein